MLFLLLRFLLRHLLLRKQKTLLGRALLLKCICLWDFDSHACLDILYWLWNFKAPLWNACTVENASP